MSWRKYYYLKRVDYIENGVYYGKYECVVCGQRFPYCSGAKNCCKDKKPFKNTDTLLQAISIVDQYPEPKKKELPRHKKTDHKAGVRYKDKWGHWRRHNKRPDPAQNFAEYSKAFDRIFKTWKKEEVMKLEKLFPTWTVEEMFNNKKPPRTAMQRLAWAYLNHNWEAVKLAAYQLAKETAIQEEVGRFRNYIAADDIVDMLTEYIKQHGGEDNEV